MPGKGCVERSFQSNHSEQEVATTRDYCLEILGISTRRVLLIFVCRHPAAVSSEDVCCIAVALILFFGRPSKQ